MSALPSLTVRVHDEIGPLRQVLVHRPGDEVVRMTQHELDLLLFDDILSPTETQREHDLMVEILGRAGATVIDSQSLLERALERAPAEARARLLEDCCELAGAGELVDELSAWSAPQLARALVAGLYWSEATRSPCSLARLRADHEHRDAMALRPLPNLMFMRDPCVAIGDGIVVGRMATEARAREPRLVAFALEHARGLEASARLFDDAAGSARSPHRSLEGGDVLVLSPRVLLIGCSDRTRAPSIERLVVDALFPAHPQLERVYAVMLPRQRSLMHLDTMLTQIDEQLFLGHRPLLTGPEALPVARLTRGRPAEMLEGAEVLDVLRSELGDDVALVPCGGEDRLHQEREQWTDGANALCLGPGHIILYSRNVHTIEALAEHGFEEVRLHVAQNTQQRQALIDQGLAARRAVFSFSGSELSRARGGGRCLTMPICRNPVDAADRPR